MQCACEQQEPQHAIHQGVIEIDGADKLLCFMGLV